jgi:iron complex outermembrane receptor protein
MIVRIAGGPSAGQISVINAPDQNIGAIDTNGLDLSVGYQFAMLPAETLSLDWQNTVLLNYRVQETPGAAFLQEAGTFPSLPSSGSLTRYKSLLSLAFKTRQWSASWSIRYLGGARVLGEDAGAPFASTPGVWYHDLGASLQTARTTWRVGVDNLADRHPPTLIDGTSNTSLNTYDVIGRFVYVRVTVER